MSHDAENEFNLDSPQEDLYDIDLVYAPDLLPFHNPYDSSLSPDFNLDGDIPSSEQSVPGDFDVPETGVRPYSAVTLSSSPERSTPVIDLTHSPLARHQQMGNASSAFQDIEQHNPSGYRAITTEASSEMAPRRTTRPRTSTTPANRARRATTSRYSTVSLGEEADENSGSSMRKRRRVDPSAGNQASSQAQPTAQSTQEEVKVEEVDLTKINDSTTLENALSKQRVDAVKDALQKSQAQDEEGRTVLTSYKCPICMDILQDATSTVCGHLFCHRCIMDTLKFSEAQRSQDTGGKARGTCPVCRKPMARNDKPDIKNRTLVPLALKLQVVPRNRDKGKGKEID